MLYDENIEFTTDYPATVLNLYNKRIIKIEKNEKGDVIFQGTENDQSGLYEHEQYVYRCVINGINFENKKFEKLLIEDAKRIGVIETFKNKKNIVTKIIILLAIYVLLYIIEKIKVHSNLMNAIQVIALSSLSFTFYGLIAFWIYKLTKKKFRRTKFGQEEAKLWNGFKNYMRDYTMISEKKK